MTTEDLTNMTVEELFNWANEFNYDLGLDVNGHTGVARELERRLEEARQKIALAKAEALEDYCYECESSGGDEYPLWILRDILATAAEYREKAVVNENKCHLCGELEAQDNDGCRDPNCPIDK